MTDTISWQLTFPGGAWGLVAALVLAVGFAWFSYGRTLRQLPWGWRWTLVALRSLLLAVLLVCLASPQKVLIHSQRRDAHKPIAVVIDGSGSMVRPDAAGLTRLALAERALAQIWKPTGEMKLFSFGEKLEPQPGPETLATITDPQRETHLLGSLRDVLNQAPPGGWGGVVALTDGADTTTGDVQATGELFRTSQVPLVLAATTTDLPQAEFIRLSEVQLPEVNVIETQYPLDVFVRSATASTRNVVVRVLQGNLPVGEIKLVIPPGPHTQKASFHFSTPTPGEQDYTVQLWEDGAAAPEDTLYVSTRSFDRPEIPVLYYAGSLSVEYRYIRAAFAEHPSIKIESAVQVGAAAVRRQILFGDQSRATSDAETFPKTLEELSQYRAIVLSDLLPAQLSDEQEQALLDYVKDGGGLIFLISNTTVASDFSGSALEQLLPVVFEPKPEGAATNSPMAGAASNLLARLQEAGDASLDESGSQGQGATPGGLIRMDFTPDGRAMLGSLGDTPIESAPMFREYAAVQRAKPGAVVAAQHPIDANAWGKRPLLAMEHFGRGRSAALATDSIWRWQLQLPSSSHAYEKLWEQIVYWVANEENAPTIVLENQRVKLGDKVPITVKLPAQVGPAEAAHMEVTAYAPDGTSQSVPMIEGADPLTYTGTVTPTGPWLRLEASVANLDRSTVVLNTGARNISSEDENLSPNLGLLHDLAAAAGGQVVDAAALHELPPLLTDSADVITQRKTVDLWDNKLVFALLLGLFCVELILRRFLKLL